MLTVSVLVLHGLCFGLLKQCNAMIPQWDLEILQRPTSRSAKRLARRYESLVSPLGIDSSALVLSINATLGTPPQPLQFNLEIASGDTNVLSYLAEECRNGECDFGAFDQNTSSTYVAKSSNFSQTYGDGTYGNGIYATDTLNIEGVSIDDFQFGFSLEANVTGWFL